MSPAPLLPPTSPDDGREHARTLAAELVDIAREDTYDPVHTLRRAAQKLQQIGDDAALEALCAQVIAWQLPHEGTHPVLTGNGFRMDDDHPGAWEASERGGHAKRALARDILVALGVASAARRELLHALLLADVTDRAPVDQVTKTLQTMKAAVGEQAGERLLRAAANGRGGTLESLQQLAKVLETEIPEDVLELLSSPTAPVRDRLGAGLLLGDPAAEAELATMIPTTAVDWLPADLRMPLEAQRGMDIEQRAELFMRLCPDRFAPAAHHVATALNIPFSDAMVDARVRATFQKSGPVAALEVAQIYDRDLPPDLARELQREIDRQQTHAFADALERIIERDEWGFRRTIERMRAAGVAPRLPEDRPGLVDEALIAAGKALHWDMDTHFLVELVVLAQEAGDSGITEAARNMLQDHPESLRGLQALQDRVPEPATHAMLAAKFLKDCRLCEALVEYQALGEYPSPDQLRACAREALRTTCDELSGVREQLAQNFGIGLGAVNPDDDQELIAANEDLALAALSLARAMERGDLDAYLQLRDRIVEQELALRTRPLEEALTDPDDGWE